MRGACLLLWAASVAFAQDTGVIEGVLLSSATGQPEKRGSVSATLQGATRAPVSTVTDAEGRFSIAGLAPGTYLVRGGGAEVDMRGRSAYSLRYVTVAAGERASVKLTTAARGAISGRVLDEDADPVPYASLQAFPRRKSEAEPAQAISAAVTDDRGEYRMGRIPPGQYYVVLLPRRQGPLRRPLLASDQSSITVQTSPAIFYPNAGDLSSATPVTVAPGAEVTGIDFESRPVATVRISGRIVGLDPNQISRCYVSLYTEGLGQPSMSNAAGGYFSIGGVAAGNYTLAASAMVDKTEYQGLVPVSVGDRDITNLTVQVAGPMTIQGRIRGAESAHMAGGSVYIAPYGRINLPRAPRTAPLNGDGSFVLTDVLPGRSQILVRLGSGDYYKAGGSLNGQPIDPGDFELPPNATGPLEIAVKSQYGAVKGSVDSVQPFGVLLLSPGRRRYWTLSGPDGEWSFDRVEPGKYVAYAYADCFDQCLGDVEPPATGGVSVTVEEGGTHHVTLRAPAIP